MGQVNLGIRQGSSQSTGPAVATVSSEYLRLLAAGMERRGVDLEPMIASAGINPAVIGRRGARIRVRLAKQVWRQISERLRDPLLGLRLVEDVPFGAADLMDYLARSSATAGAALENVTRYAPLLSDARPFRLVLSRDRASVRLETGQAMPHPVELTMGLFARRARDLFGRPWSLKQISFRHEALGPKATYERLCEAPVRFGMPYTEAVFERDLLSLPMSDADPRLNAILTAQADTLLAAIPAPERPGDLVGSIERALAGGLQPGDFTLVGLADHLGMGVRTLQRRLRDEGLTHRGLVRRLRHELAAKFLASAVPKKQIARSLGYSSRGAFRRAFTSWPALPARLRQPGDSPADPADPLPG